jgi:mono/diheme cytochrome c family protein
MEDRPQPEHQGMRGGGELAAVIGAVAVLAVVMLGIAVAAYYGGRDNATSSTVTTGGGTGGTTNQGAVNPQVAAGAHAFVQFACAQCHGDRGQGGVDPQVPALQPIAPNLTAAQLSSIIQHGAGVVDNPTRPYMPVWGEVISTQQINALIAYMKAGFPDVQYATPPPVPTNQGAAAAGAALYVRYGCINCHGPNGLGGVPNPESPDRTIPPLSGADFRSEFNTAAKIADVIKSGSVIGHAPIVSMPHWGGILSSKQIAELIAYIDTLK